MLTIVSSSLPFETLAGPAVDAIVNAVQDMFARGAPVELNYYGFNHTHYGDPYLHQIASYNPGSEVPVDLLYHAAKCLLVYKNTQLPSAPQLYENLKAAVITKKQQLGPVSDQPKEMVQDNKVKVLSEKKYGKVKIYVPNMDQLVSAKRLNSFLRERAQELGWQQKLNNWGKSDYELWKATQKGDEFDTIFLLPDFFPALVKLLQAYNAELQKKGNPFQWDYSELEQYGVSVSQPAQKPEIQKKGPRVLSLDRVPNGFKMSWDYPTHTDPVSFNQGFKNLVKQYDGVPLWDKPNKMWVLNGFPDEGMKDLENFFKKYSYDTSVMAGILEEIANKPKEEKTFTKKLVPLKLYDLTDEINGLTNQPFVYQIGIEFLPKSSGMGDTLNELIKFSFPIYDSSCKYGVDPCPCNGEGNRCLYKGKGKWMHVVRGTYADYVDFGFLAKKKGFDVQILRDVLKGLIQKKAVKVSRYPGQLDGYESSEKLKEDARSVINPKYVLFEPQEEGVEFLYGRESAFLGDDVGTGKSLMSATAAALRMKKAGPNSKTLVVTYPITQRQWAIEITDKLRDKDVYVPDDVDSFDPNKCGRWTVLRYSMFSLPKSKNNGVSKSDVLLEKLAQVKFTVLILDECHAAKNESARSERVLQLGKNIPFKWGASATISANRPLDIYRQLKAIGHRLGNISLSLFKREFCGLKPVPKQFGLKSVTVWEPKYPGSEEEAAMKLREWLTTNAGIYIRRTKKEMNPNLPNHVLETNAVDLDEIQVERLNEAIAKKMENYKDPDLAISQMIAERAEVAKAKVPYTLSLAENVLNQNKFVNDAIVPKKVLIFTCFLDAAKELTEGCQSIINKIGEEGDQVVTIMGGDPNRDAKINAFKTDPKVRVCVLSILAGGTGLDVPNVVEDVIMNDYSWTPKDAAQAEGRAFRVTSESDVTTTYVVAYNTPDQYFYEIVQKKRKLAEIIDHPKSLQELKDAKEEWNALNKQLYQIALGSQKTATNWFSRVKKAISGTF